MKSMEIKIFDDVWYECYNDMIFNIIYSIDKNYVDLIYLNEYNYTYTIESTPEGKEYKSVITKQMNDDYLYHLVFRNTKEYVYKDKNELFDALIEFLNKDCFICVHVDMFYWLPDAKTIYHKNHIIHSAFIIGYNMDEFTVVDKNIYKLKKDHVLYAIIAGGGIVETTELKNNINFPNITKDTIINNAKKIVISINEVLQVKEKIWSLAHPGKRDIDNFLAISTTHIKNIQSRQHANIWLCENKLILSRSENPFIELELECEKLSALVIKQCITYQFDNILQIRNELFKVIKKEKDFWTAIITKESEI